MRSRQTIRKVLQVVERLLLSQLGCNELAAKIRRAGHDEQHASLFLSRRGEDGQRAVRCASTEASNHRSINLDGPREPIARHGLNGAL
jgi:hypothetical protein